MSPLLKRGAIVSGVVHAAVLAGLLLGLTLRLPEEPEQPVTVELAEVPGDPSEAPMKHAIESPTPATVQAAEVKPEPPAPEPPKPEPPQPPQPPQIGRAHV